MSRRWTNREGPDRPRQLRYLLVAALVLVAAIALAACGSSGSSSTESGGTEGGGGESTGESGGGESGKSVNVAFVAWGTANGNSQATFKGVEKEAKKLGATAEIQDGALEPPKQLSIVQDDGTSGNFQAMVIQPLDGAGVSSAIEQTIEAGVSVVSVFTPIGPNLTEMKPQVPGMTAVVGGPVSESGQTIGELAVEACGSGPCEVAYMSGLGSLPLETIRTEHLEEALAKDPQAKLVAVQEAAPEKAEGIKVAQNLLAAHPDLDVLVGNNDQTALGAVQAAKESGSSVKIIGNGGSIEGIEAIRNGEMFGTFLNLPETEGEIAAELAIGAARGEEEPEFVNPGERINQPVKANAQTIGSFKGQWHAE